jgi:hypothetical protein
VALEYQRRRIDGLLGQLNFVGKLEGLIDGTITELNKLRRSSSLFAMNELIDPVSKGLEAIKDKLQEKKQEKPDPMTGDAIFDAITELFDGKVGTPYKPEEYKGIYKKGKERYEAQVPPGYMDKSNKPDDTEQYGDLLIWLQLLDHAKAKKRPIILVTDDAKEDWWREVRGEKLGPRPELVDEFIAETGGVKSFYMYSTEQFLKYAKEYLNANVRSEVIQEAEALPPLPTSGAAVITSGMVSGWLSHDVCPFGSGSSYRPYSGSLYHFGMPQSGAAPPEIPPELLEGRADVRHGPVSLSLHISWEDGTCTPMTFRDGVWYGPGERVTPSGQTITVPCVEVHQDSVRVDGNPHPIQSRNPFYAEVIYNGQRIIITI